MSSDEPEEPQGDENPPLGPGQVASETSYGLDESKTGTQTESPVREKEGVGK